MSGSVSQQQRSSSNSSLRCCSAALKYCSMRVDKLTASTCPVKF
uniref:Uncharacterized protein n=1 Tax=Rhizophora mucronata TaxID=61149 RepID=A0A2P2P3V9_RHIMU